MDGILNINKSAGITSFGVVARVKQITGERHAGHAGTLDPLATGVLPVCLGQATRVMEYLFDQTKTYRAEIELGVSTDSLDSSGKVVKTGDVSRITRVAIEDILPRFRGSIQQTPPMYSAVKHKGQPLYKLARQGLEVERKSRSAQVYSLEIIDWTPPLLTMEVTCGKGTYIRSLANDLGEALGCGANMKSLVRLRVGPFRIDDALSLTQLEEAFSTGLGENLLFPMDHVLTEFPAVLLTREQQCGLVHGSPIVLTSAAAASGVQTISRAYGVDGSFLGMLRFDAGKGAWLPDKVFARECPGCGRHEAIEPGA